MTMNIDYILENWSSICRKIPIAAMFPIESFDDLKEKCINHAHQFDHLLLVSQREKLDSYSTEISEFIRKERIINTTVVSLETDLKDKTPSGSHMLNLAQHYLKGSINCLFSENASSITSTRWKIYDIVKEMKSPLTDKIFLDSSLHYCASKPTVVIYWSQPQGKHA